MNVLIVAQCSKRALIETRRILDQFAERRGDRTWQTAITQQGLATVRQLLKKTARRNTAVACHWIKGMNQTELLWIVGNIRCFNEHGAVPTNMTRLDVLRSKDENQWHTVEVISLLAGIAGLFHDFGKANKLFQAKLKPGAKTWSEPYRHEWVSLRIFQSFVMGLSDEAWVERLANVSDSDESEILAHMQQDGNDGVVSNPFATMPPLARVVAWLIVSHHRLPKYTDKGSADSKRHYLPQLDNIDEWMTGRRFNASWNSPQCEYDTWKKSDWAAVWRFDAGTPFRSETWRRKAKSIANRANKHRALFGVDWLSDPFTSHLSRLVLMLADHSYSAGAPVSAWQDRRYKAFANTDRKTRRPKQKLDEHNIGVGHNAVLLAKCLPQLRLTLPAITRHKGFKQRSDNDRFRWQDKAFELAQGIARRSDSQGFFGINMASTGCGKTFANGRIMYGLANEQEGCRFSVALGLRTLTLQTGDALKARLKLADDDLAVLIGSQSVRDLHELNNKGASINDRNDLEKTISAEQAGSESAEAVFAEHQYVQYSGSLDDGRFSAWLNLSPKLHQLVSAPILVSTIDHLMPATEGDRGGRQIAPMLRLLTSDLVLDEPDDFDLDDMPALARLVNWVGMLGARVLLSSATLPPALISALFDAYCTGRKRFNAVRGYLDTPDSVCCAWFDEFRVAQSDHRDLPGFAMAHEQFVKRRVASLQKQPSIRWAELLAVNTPSTKEEDVIRAAADAVLAGVYDMHDRHNQEHKASKKRVSVGLVRMANINPMVALAQQIVRQSARSGYCLHFCLYHSRHPLIVRSEVERELDAVLDRHQPDSLWAHASVHDALTNGPEQNHIFVVFGTAVTEVGRDHDYDWAIAEPSSMRSLIQLAGRVQRHRQYTPEAANLFILNRNIRALKGERLAYAQPGFEKEPFVLRNKDLAEALLPEQYQHINAIPRIQPASVLDASGNLADLEHVQTHARLLGADGVTCHASLWWLHHASWCGELQRRDPFRKSAADELFVLYLDGEMDEPVFHQMSDRGDLLLVEDYRFERVELELGAGMLPWIQVDFKEQIEEIAELRSMEVNDASKKFGEIRLRESDRKWQYHPLLGVFRRLF
ncbi:MAG TPA: type I-F CRISPR-associated helicase Cas3f [Burkholderiaceae bacterium]|nr:type I-F CRISPR-associated helicase Cas3f [Burkholderiaceae bacterium]